MDHKIRWTLLSLLGFATACGATKQNSKRSLQPPEIYPNEPIAVAMYGVRLPLEPMPEQDTLLMEERKAVRSQDSVVRIGIDPQIRVMYGVASVPLTEDGNEE